MYADHLFVSAFYFVPGGGANQLTMPFVYQPFLASPHCTAKLS